jgi:AAA family ATP:ADP antiporter
MAPDAAAAAPRSAIDRFLSIFAEVRAGEGPLIVALAVNVFTVMLAYYVLKVVREPLVLTEGAFGMEGATLKAAAAAAQALLLVAVVPLYALLASRVDRVRLINVVTAVFIACLLGFFALSRAGVPIGFAFFVWVGVFNVFVVAQFWSFANDLYTPEAGKRVFAIVAFGQTSGAIAGAAVAGWLFKRIGPQGLFLIAAALLVGAAALSTAISHAAGAAPRPKAREEGSSSQRGGFRLVLRSRYLLLIALMILIYNTVNTDGEFILGETVVEKARAIGGDEKAMIGVFYAGYFAAVNVVTALLQLFVVSRILKWFGVRVALLIMPAISLGAYGIIAVLPVLWLIKGAKILENSVDYSVQNTTRQTLFLPTSRAEKYQAKAAIDTFFVRFGDVASFGLVALSTAVLGLGVKAVAIINIALVVCWGVLALAVGRRHDELAR